MYSLLDIAKMRKLKIFCSIIIILFGIILIGYPKIIEKIAEKNQIESVKKYDEDILNSEENIKNEEYKKAEKYNQMINGELLNNKELDYNNILNISVRSGCWMSASISVSSRPIKHKSNISANW